MMEQSVLFDGLLSKDIGDQHGVRPPFAIWMSSDGGSILLAALDRRVGVM